MLPNLEGWPVGVVSSKAKFAQVQMRLYPKVETDTEVYAPFCDINASREKLLFLVAEKRTYGGLPLITFLITTRVIIKVVTISSFIPRAKKIKDIFTLEIDVL